MFGEFTYDYLPVTYLDVDPVQELSEFNMPIAAGVIKIGKIRISQLVLPKGTAFPVHLQLSFYADHLERLTSSSELTVASEERLLKPIVWKEQKLPSCFSAYKSHTMLQQGRLLILLWLTNSQNDLTMIGQANISLQEVNGILEETKFSSNVVLCNRKVGTLEATMLYDELDEKQYRMSTLYEEEKQKKKRAMSKYQKQGSVVSASTRPVID